jgi:ribosomal protein S18 acetylase RimI-like enzyme
MSPRRSHTRAVDATTRPYAGPIDFELMGRIVTESWQRAGERASCTVGDLEWWTVNDPDQELEGQAWIWLADGEPVGWEWQDPPFAADWHLRPGVDRGPFLDQMLDRLEAGARAARAADPDAPPAAARQLADATQTWAMDTDADAVEVLLRRGYEPTEMAFSQWLRTLPAAGGPAVPVPALPPGYRHAPTRWPEDLAARVEVHRSAFAPSRMTVEKYQHLIAKPHYAPERDRVIVAPDGTFAAFANGWFDPDALVGELEPVGAHADHRRLGLARAVCFEAIRRLEAAGARQVVIDSSQSNAASEALYESLGCVRASTTRRYARPLDT